MMRGKDVPITVFPNESVGKDVLSFSVTLRAAGVDVSAF